MSYLDTINRQGLLAKIRHGNVLWFDPQELITDDIRQFAREHKDELIAEIKEANIASDISTQEITKRGSPDHLAKLATIGGSNDKEKHI